MTPELSKQIEQLFMSKLDKEYDLVYVDYRDSLDNHPQLIERCIDNGHCDELWEAESDWYMDARWEAVREEIKNIKSSLLNDSSLTHLHDLIIEWIEDPDNYDTIRFAIEERDTSDPISEIIGNTCMRGRIMLHTNYDCLPHNFDMGNTYWYEEYVKDIVDVLNLNPALVKRSFIKKGIIAKGAWPNKPNRNGNEYVRYDDFSDELLNQSCYTLLTFTGTLPLKDMYDNGFRNITHITIPAGNYCGLYGSWNGGGSLLGMELLRDLTINLEKPLKRKDATKCDSAYLYVDERGCSGYCIDEVYGMSYSFWKNDFIIHYEEDQEITKTAA